MAASGSTKRGKRSRRKLVLVFGENENDTKTLAHLLRALRPDADWTVEPRKRPPVLIKDAKLEDLPSRVERILAVVRAEEVSSEIIAFFAHEDCDAVEPAHEELAAKMRNAFRGCKYQVEPAVPAWETEAWLMQWPDAFPLHVQGWPSVDSYRGRRVGLIVNAKEDLVRALRTRQGGREYRESDAPHLAHVVAEHGWARAPRARSDSYLAFVDAADRIGES